MLHLFNGAFDFVRAFKPIRHGFSPHKKSGDRNV
jgi:hypothetical protein